jgi:hypothetical protein
MHCRSAELTCASCVQSLLHDPQLCRASAGRQPPSQATAPGAQETLASPVPSTTASPGVPSATASPGVPFTTAPSAVPASRPPSLATVGSPIPSSALQPALKAPNTHAASAPDSPSIAADLRVTRPHMARNLPCRGRRALGRTAASATLRTRPVRITTAHGARIPPYHGRPRARLARYRARTTKGKCRSLRARPPR